MKKIISRTTLLGKFLSFWLCLATLVTAQQTRPLSENILPETTVAYIQLRDFREYLADINNSNIGRMMKDEKVAPLVDDLYGQAKDAFTDFQDQIGLKWEDIEQLPSGEICFAVVAPKRADTQFALIMDVNPESPAFDNILERGKKLAEEQGRPVEEEDTGEVKYKTFKGPDAEFTQFRIGDTVIVTSDRKLADEIVERWMGRPIEKIRPLSENRKFVTIMNRCRGTKDTPPEMRFFIDPIEMVRSLSRGEVGMQTALNFLPALGLDGFLGVGGAAIFDEMEFESVVHMHLLLANPRAGILEMLAMKPGQYKPDAWVADDTGAYMSTSWDVPKMFAELNKIVDTFMGENGLKTQIENNVNKELEMNLEEDILPALSGRVTMATWIEPGGSVNSQVNGFGIGLKDVEKAEMVIDKILARIEKDNNSGTPRISDASYKGVKLWVVNNEQQRSRLQSRRDEGQIAVSIRAPEPSFAIVGETFVIADSRKYLENAIDTFKGDKKSLGENEEFLEAARHMTNLLGTDMPAGVMYSQPGPTFEMMLNMAKSDDVSRLLDQNSEENKYLSRLKDTLKKTPLPSYEDIKEYFKPSGGFITADDTGYHMLQFQLKGEK